VSARAGVVAALVDRWEDTDWDPNHFNHVYVRHEDGFAAFYAHLQLGSLRVRQGEAVSAGQRIGSSGHCGTPVADLHFGVYRWWPVADGQDLPVSFRNADGPLDSRGGLQRGSCTRPCRTDESAPALTACNSATSWGSGWRGRRPGSYRTSTVTLRMRPVKRLVAAV
jgi:murein DD-endopeptidase MepM/ murein hydrolase activator NlpD